jgi:hypothetical protein
MVMGKEMVVFDGSDVLPSVIDLLPICKGALFTKTLYRGSKAYGRYLSHGLKDPVFIANISSDICAGASLLTLGSSKVVKLTPLSSWSEPLFLASSGLGSVSDALDKSFKWHSPFM